MLDLICVNKHLIHCLNCHYKNWQLILRSWQWSAKLYICFGVVGMMYFIYFLSLYGSWWWCLGWDTLVIVKIYDTIVTPRFDSRYVGTMFLRPRRNRSPGKLLWILSYWPPKYATQFNKCWTLHRPGEWDNAWFRYGHKRAYTCRYPNTSCADNIFNYSQAIFIRHFLAKVPGPKPLLVSAKQTFLYQL